MAVRPKSLAVATMLLLALILACRLFWVASTTETGWRVLLCQWWDNTAGWFGWKYVPVDEREPTDQADFWLAEVEQILSCDPELARLHVAAAWLLDSPGRGFWKNHLKPADDLRIALASQIPELGFPEMDYAAIELAEAEFESKCRRKCLACSRSATELAPDDVGCRRTRAVLEWRHSAARSAGQTRGSGLYAMLDECAWHDPENALYDYLAALQFWSTAATLELEDDGYRARISHDDLFAKGTKRFEHGLRKQVLVVGETGYPAVVGLLHRSSLPTTERVAALRSCRNNEHLITVMLKLRDWNHARQAAEGTQRNATSEAVTLRQNLRVLDQLRNGEDANVYHDWTTAVGNSDLKRLTTLVGQDPQVVPEEEIRGLEQQYEALSLDDAIRREGTALMSGSRQANNGPRRLASAAAMAVALESACLMLVVAIVGWSVGRALANRALELQPGLGWFRHTCAWFIGYGLTFAILGMAPAEVISRSVQSWAIWTVVSLAATGLVGLLLWKGCRYISYRLAPRERQKPSWQFSLRALFYVTLGFSIIFAIMTACGIRWGDLADLRLDGEPTVWLPARGYGHIHPSALEAAFRNSGGPWAWALVQWWCFRGPYIAPALSLVLVAGWSIVRCGVSSPESIRRYWLSRRTDRWSGLLRRIGGAAMSAAAVLLLVYLTLAPDVLRTVESDHKEKMAYYCNPQEYWATVRSLMEEIKMNSESTEQLREEAAEGRKVMVSRGMAQQRKQQRPIWRPETVPLMEQTRPESRPAGRVSVPKRRHDRFSARSDRPVKLVSKPVV